MSKEIFKKKVNGMICPQCEDEIYKAVIHQKGVINADISYRKSEVTATYESSLISETEIEELLDKIGYPVGSGGSGVKSDIAAAVAVIVLCLVIPLISGSINVPEVGNKAGIGIVFLVGILSGVHCIAMCGGIMLTQKNRLLYNAGRVLSYMAAGAVFGATGKALSFDNQMKSMIFTMCGICVLIIGLRMWGVPILRKISPELKGRCALNGGSFGVGILNGFMPCAILSAMWVNAAGSGSWRSGMEMMFSFGLGTCIFMLALAYFGAAIPGKYKKYIIKINTVLIVSLGILQIIKGLKIIL